MSNSPNGVDLRSDTVTRPSEAMRRAIASADVGDDVLGDDPTVLRLQERAAALLGKEAAVYTPSGTMANQIAIRSATEPGDELIADVTTHSYHYETGGPAALSGCSFRMTHSPRGIFTPAEAEALVRPESQHFARTRMIIVENTNNRGGGSVWPVEQVREMRAVADRHGLHLHIDGARLMNACVARGCAPTAYTDSAHSVSMCFSKGLGAPVGSILAGDKAFITRAHRFRKMFGGAMRQAGLLAAAALYALEHNGERLAEDHANAKWLAEQIASLPGINLDPATCETNIVLFEIDPKLGTAAAFSETMAERGVRFFATAAQSCRLVTHKDVSRDQIEQAVKIFAEVCRAA